MRLKLILAGLGGLLLAGLLIAWSLERAGGARFLVPLAQVSPLLLLPALACEVTVQCCKALKWTGLLASLKRVSFRSALAAVLIGGAATHLVPLRLDEVLRAKVLGDREELPAAAVLGTVAVDRVLEILVLGSLLGLIAATGGLPGALNTALWVAWAGFLLGAAVLLGFVLQEQRLSAALNRVPLLSRLAPLARDMARGLRGLPRGPALARVLAGTAGEWGATMLMYVVVLHAFGLRFATQVPLTLAVGGAAAYGVPNVPGALGAFEATQTTLLEATMQLPPAQALAVALLSHAVLTVPITLAGAWVALGMALSGKAQSTR